MIKSELLRASEAWEKKHPIRALLRAELSRFRADECGEFKQLCEDMAEQVATLFVRRRAKMERASIQLNLKTWLEVF